MSNIKNIIFLLILLTGVNSQAQDTLKKIETLTWYTDITKASEISKETNKPIFAFFTGSDWCGWCRKLQNDVFSKPEFIKWAKENVVLVELDFPKNKKLSPELTQQNASLQQTFQVRGYPTIFIFFLNKKADGTNFEIENLGSLGYPQGTELGKEEVKFLKDANLILQNRVKK